MDQGIKTRDGASSNIIKHGDVISQLLDFLDLVLKSGLPLRYSLLFASRFGRFANMNLKHWILGNNNLFCPMVSGDKVSARAFLEVTYCPGM